MSDFTPAIKQQARKLAFFKCCYCIERQGDDVHHLIPKEEGGPGTLDNAILLCVQCHANYGHRPEKREQLRQARDHWYEIAAARYGPATLLELEKVDALRGDISAVKNMLRNLTDQMLGNLERGSTSPADVANVASTIVSSMTASAQLYQGPDINKVRHVTYDTKTGKITDVTDDDK
jgi:hypothetical protein